MQNFQVSLPKGSHLLKVKLTSVSVVLGWWLHYSYLHNSLPQSDEIRPNSNGATGSQRDCNHIFVRIRRLPSNHSYNYKTKGNPPVSLSLSLFVLPKVGPRWRITNLSFSLVLFYIFFNFYYTVKPPISPPKTEQGKKTDSLNFTWAPVSQ